jgi:hypothetical protein
MINQGLFPRSTGVGQPLPDRSPQDHHRLNVKLKAAAALLVAGAATLADQSAAAVLEMAAGRPEAIRS